MSLPKGAAKAAREFARAILRRKWDEVPPLCTTALRATLTVEALAAEFGWSALGPRLRREHIAATGEDEAMVPELDPPRRFEVFEVEERDPPAGHDPRIPLGWVEVDFLPSQGSEFDACYNCFLAFVDEAGPRVAAYDVEGATE
ncbi:hypothetical protein [Paludisphaera mucosa]|uniref:Uncharacterized protein n=1 Tax=Paludisphaera mucosa TaxID=3030827 RepID=A0ABT6FC17_9BACT|nr:hypothetical protein [Paludisphaera mucosa]MDG3004999.1 hypothetical protein [Paludisphaera mucosa]